MDVEWRLQKQQVLQGGVNIGCGFKIPERGMTLAHMECKGCIGTVECPRDSIVIECALRLPNLL